MYAGHDMSAHEVVVRSLLEVLQEFDDASEGDRTVGGTWTFCSLLGVCWVVIVLLLSWNFCFMLACHSIVASCFSVFVDWIGCCGFSSFEADACDRSITDLAGATISDSRTAWRSHPKSNRDISCPPSLPYFLQTAPSIARGGEGGDNRKLQLLLLLSAFPKTGEEAEQFALRGNFTTEAANIKKVKVRTATDFFGRSYDNISSLGGFSPMGRVDI